MVQTDCDTEGLFHRVGEGPILSSDNWPYPASGLSSPAATRTPDGETLLLCRVEAYNARPHLCAARSVDGLTNWRIDPVPTLLPNPQVHPEEEWGIEDPRITYLAELKKYAVTYTARSINGPCASLALTEDFRLFQRLGGVLHPDNKHAALFPKRIDGSWAMVNRPRSTMEADMWISYSLDLVHWGSHKILMRTRQGSWDEMKISIGPPPIATSEGWLVLYYGARKTSSGPGYHVGLALLDLEDPSKVIRRSKGWVFGHERDYVGVGDAHGIGFSCGTMPTEDGDGLLLYYGCATTEISVSRASVRELLDWLRTDAGS